MPPIVRTCSELLKSSSARSTFTWAFVGTARTWRGPRRRRGRVGGRRGVRGQGGGVGGVAAAGRRCGGRRRRGRRCVHGLRRFQNGLGGRCSPVRGNVVLEARRLLDRLGGGIRVAAPPHPPEQRAAL